MLTAFSYSDLILQVLEDELIRKHMKTIVEVINGFEFTLRYAHYIDNG